MVGLIFLRFFLTDNRITHIIQLTNRIIRLTQFAKERGLYDHI